MVETTIHAGGEEYSISVNFSGYLSGHGLSQAGEFYVTTLIGGSDAAKTFAAEHLLETYNESWTDDDHPMLTAAAFMQKLQLRSILILDQPDSADLFFGDGDMFGGHEVVVSIQGAGPAHAELMG